MADPRTIQQMQADLQTFRAKRNGTSAPTATATPQVAPAPTADPKFEKMKADLAASRSARASGTATEVPKDPGALASFAKGLFSAPATIAARPFQAVAAVAGASNDQIDEFTNKIPVLGGLIEDAPDSGKDVMKDVGRAAQTVALGTGAPIAGGALFGAGASLEQGNDLFSAQTAVDAALGGAGGKVLEWVGKPLFNAAGKVVGKITPTIIKDVAGGGAKAIAKFAEEHQLLGGIAAKPSATLEAGMQKIDSSINKGFKQGGAALAKTASEQFPGLNPVEHFKKVNERDLSQATRTNEAGHAKATRVYNEAARRDINLEQVGTERNVVHDKLHAGGKYNTTDTVDTIRQEAYTQGNEKFRPAIKIAQYGTRNVPVSEVRAAMLQKVNEIPPSEIRAAQRQKMIDDINKTYADDGVEAAAHPNGYNLEALHDSRIASQRNGKYKIGQPASDALNAQRSREEARVFAQIFDTTAPEALGASAVKKELEKSFMLADYLESLHGKKVPEGVAKKAVRLFGKAVAATVGGKLGGFPGAILGSQYGDMLFRSFVMLDNPLKMAALNSLKKEEPAAFKALVEYAKKHNPQTYRDIQAMMGEVPRLPGAGGSSFKETAPTLFTTPGGKSTFNKGEAVDVTAVEQGRSKTGSSLKGKRLKDMIQGAQENQGPYTPPSKTPTIKAGTVPKKPKSLSDIKF